MEFKMCCNLRLIISICSLIIINFHGIATANPQPKPSAVLDPAIKKICDITQYPIVCGSTIIPYLNGKTDPTSVLTMQIQAGMQATENAIKIAKQQQQHPTTTTTLYATCIRSCLASFHDAMKEWKTALNQTKYLGIGSAVNPLGSAYSSFIECGDKFNIRDRATGVPNKSPFDQTMDLLMKMATNAIDISYKNK